MDVSEEGIWMSTFDNGFESLFQYGTWKKLIKQVTLKKTHRKTMMKNELKHCCECHRGGWKGIWLSFSGVSFNQYN